MTMISLTQNLTPETYEKIFSEWLGIINSRECGSIIHFPKRDQLYRVHAFLQSKEIQKKYLKAPQEFQCILLDLTAEPIEDSSELEKFIKSQIKPKSNQIALFVLDADKLIDEKMSLISSLNNLYHRFPTLSILYFFGKNITYPSLTAKLSSYTTSLYQNIQIFPYLSQKDSYHFVHYLEKKLDTAIPVEVIKKIVGTCGGISWLIKQACRYYSKTKDPKHIFDHEEMRVKIHILANEFMPEEKEVLEKIIKRNFLFNPEEKHIVTYFIKSNTLVKKNEQYYLFSPLLEDYLNEQLSKKLKIEAVNNRDLVINGVAMNNYFSKREKQLLLYLVNNKGEIIDRDSAAKIIWKENQDSYTDWALDQFILRLRKKLLSLGFEKNFIKTVKNRGFIIS